ncbi:carboxymethylenebutenolidase [Acrasis kona]|uniref:Carboxymethylenebutenolidase n=1 Tax=Acrasis kona TaxID=1008807 RepID=A0AAW2Z1J4_9EUKA
MLIKESHVDVNTSSGLMRVHIYAPNLARYPNARFPGVAVFTEIYQVTGPVERFCRKIASEGHVVACPESYHEFEPIGTVIPYDNEGTDRGNKYKIQKELSAYDEDAKLTLDVLAQHSKCNGRLAATGMCLGGHLAFRCAFDKRVEAAVCYFATDIHSETLGKGKKSDSLVRCKEITGELLMIFGKQDTHIPTDGRQLIYNTLTKDNVIFSWCEYQAQHAFIRDESSKDRYDAALSRVCFESMMELFKRTIWLQRGEAESGHEKIEHVC